MDSWAVVLQQYAKCTRMFQKEHCDALNKRYFECYDKCLVSEKEDMDQFKQCIQMWSNEECVSAITRPDNCRQKCL
jgi:hypothetical protein